PVGTHVVGEQFTITGSTNLAVGDDLMVEITSSSFKPTSKSQSVEFSGASGMVKVVPGSGTLNRWSFTVDASAFKPDEYIVKVSGITVDVTGSTLFNIVAKLPTTPATPVPVVTEQTQAPVTTTIPSPTPVPKTQKAPVPVTIMIGAIGLAIIASTRRRK
ncbi:MAG: hypothetical protein ACYDDV_11360, partial [Methanoregula sp.]